MSIHSRESSDRVPTPVRPATKRVRRLGAIVAAALLLVTLPLAGVAPAATDDCYLLADAGLDSTSRGVDAEDVLTRLDPSDASGETVIGSTGTFDAESAAFQPATGTLFTVDGGQLGTINLTTGAYAPSSAPVGAGPGAGELPSVTFDNIDGLAFESSGALLASQREDGPDLLIRINPATGAHVANAFGPGADYVAIEPVAGLVDVDDLAIDPTNGTLYAIANDGGKNDRLVIIDPSTGATTDVGPTGVEDMEALGFTTDGGLLGLVGKDGTGESLWDVDKATGSASNRRALTKARDYEAVTCRAAPAPPPQSPAPTVAPTVQAVQLIAATGPSVLLPLSLLGLALFALGCVLAFASARSSMDSPIRR